MEIETSDITGQFPPKAKTDIVSVDFWILAKDKWDTKHSVR